MMSSTTRLKEEGEDKVRRSDGRGESFEKSGSRGEGSSFESVGRGPERPKDKGEKTRTSSEKEKEKHHKERKRPHLTLARKRSIFPLKKKGRTGARKRRLLLKFPGKSQRNTNQAGKGAGTEENSREKKKKRRRIPPP